MAHNFYVGAVNNYNGAKDVNTGANYGAHPNVVVPACLVSNLTINQNDHRGAMLSREPFALPSHNYQRSRGQGSRPPNHHAYSAPPASHYYDEQKYHYNDYQPSAFGHPRSARRYQDRPRYWPSHPYLVDSRDEEISSRAMEDACPRDDICRDAGEEFSPHGAYALSAEGYTPAFLPRSKSDVVASATFTSYASLQSGPPGMNSNNPFGEAFCFPTAPEFS